MKPPLPASNPSVFFSTPSRVIRILGSRIDVLAIQQMLTKAETLLASPKAHQIVTANALMLLEAKRSPLLFSAIENADMVTIDSTGLSWAARFLNLQEPERIPGIDLAQRLCELAQSNSISVYLLGGKPSVAERAAAFLQSKYPQLNITGTHHGYFLTHDEAKIINDIKEKQAKLIFVALGMPRQEQWIRRHLSDLPGGIYIGIGGAFDVWAGDVTRAPFWMQKRGLEWLYRLTQEPFRWRRIAQLPRFVLLVIKQRIIGFDSSFQFKS